MCFWTCISRLDMGGKDDDVEMRELQPSEVDAVSFSDSGHASDIGSQRSYDDDSIGGDVGIE